MNTEKVSVVGCPGMRVIIDGPQFAEAITILDDLCTNEDLPYWAVQEIGKATNLLEASCSGLERPK